MSRYRKIEVRTWSDEKFRELSAIPPSGQGLWFFLLTGPHTTAIPGLFRAGRAAMAEELGWDQEAFDKAFMEVSGQGMAKADFKAKLVWLPKAIQHNKPESPNVVRGWRVELDLLPECDLKREAIAGIREALESAGPSYVESFDELQSAKQKDSAKPSTKPSAKAMANQEQEQEQEQNSSSLRSEESATKSPRTPRPKKEDCTLSTYLATCRACGQKPIPAEHPIRAYCADAGISDEMLQVAWITFRDDHMSGEKAKKRYRDWPATFANSVRDRWYKLWFSESGEGDSRVGWTSNGLQAKRVIEARMAAKEAQHESA